MKIVTKSYFVKLICQSVISEMKGIPNAMWIPFQQVIEYEKRGREHRIDSTGMESRDDPDDSLAVFHRLSKQVAFVDGSVGLQTSRINLCRLIYRSK